MPRTIVAGAAIAAALLAGCASPTSDPTALADAATKAVYNVDVNGTTAHMDDATKAQVTAQSVGYIADRMHALGSYKGLKPTASDPDRGRYAYEANFDRGTLLVELRLDPDGKIGAYRVAPDAAN